MEQKQIIQVREVDDLQELLGVKHYLEMDDSKNKIDIAINPPPIDMCCEICGKHVSLLESFWDEDPMPFFIEGRCVMIYMTKDNKLQKKFREVSQIIFASWECKSCYCLPNEKLENFPPKAIHSMISQMKEGRA